MFTHSMYRYPNYLTLPQTHSRQSETELIQSRCDELSSRVPIMPLHPSFHEELDEKRNLNVHLESPPTPNGHNASIASDGALKVTPAASPLNLSLTPGAEVAPEIPLAMQMPSCKSTTECERSQSDTQPN